MTIDNSKRERLAIIGSRSYAALQEVWTYVMQLPLSTIIISGGASGVDSKAEECARSRRMSRGVHEPLRWTGQTKGEYAAECLKRNVKIINACDRVVAFREAGKSRGTDHALRYARKIGKPYEVMGPGRDEVDWEGRLKR